MGTRSSWNGGGEYFNCEALWSYRLISTTAGVQAHHYHTALSNILLTSLNFLLRAETTKTQMRADVLLAVPAWPKCGNTDKRTAKTGMRGHLEGLLIWESWGLEMECRGEENLGLRSGCSRTGTSCAMSSKLRASWDGGMWADILLPSQQRRWNRALLSAADHSQTHLSADSFETCLQSALCLSSIKLPRGWHSAIAINYFVNLECRVLCRQYKGSKLFWWSPKVPV